MSTWSASTWSATARSSPRASSSAAAGGIPRKRRSSGRLPAEPAVQRLRQAAAAGRSERMCGQMLEYQFADAVRHLVGGEMAGARQHFEGIGRGNEIDRALGGGAADGVVGVPPDIER